MYNDFYNKFSNENNVILIAKLESLGKKFDLFYLAGEKMTQTYINLGTNAGNTEMDEFDNHVNIIKSLNKIA